MSDRPAAVPAEAVPAEAATIHPLEASDRLAWQATAAVGLLERFGGLVTVALDAVGSGDDAALLSALGERERLLQQLEPLLADLAAARQTMTGGLADGTNARRALASILRPVDEALRYANLLHARLTDEVGDRTTRGTMPTTARRAPIALVR